jgi:hypothetical protein
MQVEGNSMKTKATQVLQIRCQLNVTPVGVKNLICCVIKKGFVTRIQIILKTPAENLNSNGCHTYWQKYRIIFYWRALVNTVLNLRVP